MKTITIKGEFLESDNNWLVLDVYAPNYAEKPYDFKKNYNKNFEETLVDLEDDSIYYIDLAGYTTGTFKLSISGEIDPPNPIKETIEKTGFSLGYTIKTKK